MADLSDPAIRVQSRIRFLRRRLLRLIDPLAHETGNKKPARGGFDAPGSSRLTMTD